MKHNRIDSASAMGHAAKADLHRRAAEIIKHSIFSSRYASRDIRVLEEALLALFQREADFHEMKAFKLRHFSDAKEQAEAVFEPSPKVDEITAIHEGFRAPRSA